MVNGVSSGITLTDILAFWGAIVATANVVWTFSRDWNDRGRLEVKAVIGKIVPDRMDKDRIIITVTNIGRRPITVTGLYGALVKSAENKNSFFVKTQYLPRKLVETESITEVTELLEELPHVKSLLVYDSSGGKWHLPGRALKLLKKQALEPPKNEPAPKPESV